VSRQTPQGGLVGHALISLLFSEKNEEAAPRCKNQQVATIDNWNNSYTQ
jgi:hypothetical protein